MRGATQLRQLNELLRELVGRARRTPGELTAADPGAVAETLAFIDDVRAHSNAC